MAGLSVIGLSKRTLCFRVDLSGNLVGRYVKDEVGLISVVYSARSMEEPWRTLSFFSACCDMRCNSETNDSPHQALILCQ